MTRLRTLGLVLSFALLALPTPASAQMGPCVLPDGEPCASKVDQTTQIAKEVELIQKATTQIQTDQNILTNAQSQLQQLEAAGQQLTSGQWNGIDGIIGRIQQLNMISSDTAQLNQSIVSHFHSDYPAYTNSQTYQSQFAQWNATTTQAEAQALSIANASDASTKDVNTQLSNIAGSTPAGQTEAIQRLTQVVVILTQQVNRLLDLQSASMKSMSYYLQQQQRMQEADCQQTITQNPFAAMGAFASNQSPGTSPPQPCK